MAPVSDQAAQQEGRFVLASSECRTRRAKGKKKKLAAPPSFLPALCVLAQPIKSKMQQPASSAAGGQAATKVSARAHTAMLNSLKIWGKLKCAVWFGEPVDFAGYTDRIAEPSK